MLKRIQQYLLTKYPLLWNTRFVWMMLALFIIHLLFFVSGFVEIRVKGIHDYYSVLSVGGFSMFTFSILCSLAVVIGWLIFYLRNNAFKNFYIIDRYHSVKEFILVFIILLASATFFESYQWGAVVKTRMLISKEELVKDANILNLAKAFIPQSKQDYFLLNNCENKKVDGSTTRENEYSITPDAYPNNDTTRRKIEQALKQKDAFSYRNYCFEVISLPSYKGFVDAHSRSATIKRWIDNHQTDSIKNIINQILTISTKYGIEQGTYANKWAEWVFLDSNYNVTNLVEAGTYNNNNQAQEGNFFNQYSIDQALSFTDRIYLGDTGSGDWTERIIFDLYLALCMSILLLCYRLFSKRVFLISVLGTILWSIVFALLGGMSQDGNFLGGFYIFLFLIFTAAGIAFSNSNSGGKTATGVLLNWHLYMLPFLVMIIMFMIEDNYSSHRYLRYSGEFYSEEYLQKNHPIGYWVTSHTSLLFRLNLLFVFLYTAFCFTHFARKWHIKAAE